MIKRFVPEIPFPLYAHVPGLTPHPNHPGGHSYGITHPPPQPLDPTRWRECKMYLYGIDLFNGPAAGTLPHEPRGHLPGYYWEAHEAWEGLWRAAGRGATADFLKGLIQLAVAGVKHAQGIGGGVTTHARRAADLFRGTSAERLLGFSVAELIASAEAIGRDGWPDPPPLLLPAVD